MVVLCISFCRYPVILLRFHLNPGTGGDGFHRGGDGVVRELLFRRNQVLSVLCERRSAFQPYGLQGNKQFSLSTVACSSMKIMLINYQQWRNIYFCFISFMAKCLYLLC